MAAKSSSRSPTAPPPPSEPPATRTSLLLRAASLYLREGQRDAACRCLERAGDHARAAALHDQDGRHQAAAAGYERAEMWSAAARAHAAAAQRDPRHYADAARCHEAAGEIAEAAWLLAHHLGQRERALALLATMPEPETPAPGAPRFSREALLPALIRARCHTATRPREAAALIRHITQAIGRRDGFVLDLPLLTRAQALAESLHRPDLTAALFAAISATGHAPLTEAWAAWARERLGSAEAVPAPPVFPLHENHPEGSAA